MHVPEDPVTLVVEGAGHDDSGHLRARAAPTLPAAHHLRVGLGVGHVGQGNLQAALEGPQLVHALELNGQLLTGDLDPRHVHSSQS